MSSATRYIVESEIETTSNQRFDGQGHPSYIGGERRPRYRAEWLPQIPQWDRTLMVRSLLVAILLVLSSADSVSARPPYRQGLKRSYGDALPQTMQACSTCHLTKEQVENTEEFDESAPPHNVFGIRLANLEEELRSNAQAADIVTRIAQVGEEDADGDGVPNDVEILSNHNPGIATDKPDANGIALVANAVSEIVRQRVGYRWEPFQPVQRPSVPQVKHGEWNNHLIDAFVAADHELRGLMPRPEATRAVLLRRVTLDLTGLPPTPEELHSFLSDESPDAYEKRVDRLLSSPHHGERWGRHWMDVWRYSDWAGWTGGKQIRDSQPHIWRWRDWII